MHAPHACDPTRTRGRRVPEDESTFRSPFQRDRDRIIHASAFRRLKHKTQVFVEHEGDYFRTRLTHSIEVAQVAAHARAWASTRPDRGGACGMDLATPFGLTGEACVASIDGAHGVFDLNARAFD